MNNKLFLSFLLPFRWMYHLLRNFFRLILPNMIFFTSGRYQYSRLPSFEQKIILSGKGKIITGTHCVFGYKLGGFHRGGSVELQARYSESLIKIGNNIATNNNVFICAAQYIEIGDDTLIGQGVSVMDHEAHGTAPEKRRQTGKSGQVIIGKNVWIGNNVIILKNTSIGNNSIVAAGAVVKGNFPENVIIGGIPARIIKPL